MVQTIQISMMNEIIEVNLRENIINKSTIRSAFFLEDEAKVSLTFEIDGRKVFCQVNEINTAFELPDGWPNILFYARSDKLPSRVTTPIVQTLIERPISPYYQSCRI
ncbi:unnamed protein product [Auanema sp. JU1783]|nr:unnamed protein product [Auanema sp. JU1783]